MRHVATPLPWFPPNPTAILTMEGITAMHLASLITLSGMALSGVAIISFSTLADASIRLAMSDCLSSSPAQLTPMKMEQMPSTRRYFGSNESCRIRCVLFILCSTRAPAVSSRDQHDKSKLSSGPSGGSLTQTGEVHSENVLLSLSPLYFLSPHTAFTRWRKRSSRN